MCFIYFFICCKLKIKPLDVLSTLLYWVEVVESISGGSFVWRGVVCYLDMVNLQAGTTAFNNMCMHCWTLCETVGDKQAVIKRTEALSLKNGCSERWLCLCCEAGVWSEQKMQCKLKRKKNFWQLVCKGCMSVQYLCFGGWVWGRGKNYPSVTATELSIIQLLSTLLINRHPEGRSCRWVKFKAHEEFHIVYQQYPEKCWRCL